MTALLLDGAPANVPTALSRVPLASGETGPSEQWRRDLLFRHPELMLLDRTDPGAGPVVPLCREFRLPRHGGAVLLDFLSVTPTGRLVLVECKLWHNPEVRRQVVAQLLEYAALLRGWTYGNLTARLKQSKAGRAPTRSSAGSGTATPIRTNRTSSTPWPARSPAVISTW